MQSKPEVELLWEEADPDRELSKRFGFTDSSAAAEWVAEALAHHWGIEVGQCERLVISDRNALAWVNAGDRRLIVKWSSMPERFDRLEDAARLVTWLGTQGLPVAAPVPAEDGRLLVDSDQPANGSLLPRPTGPSGRSLLAVLPVVEGDLLNVDDPVQLADAGRMLALLHEALAAFPDQIRGRDRQAGEQLVHHDFRSANLLHDGADIAAVLDFEEIDYDARVGDLARSAVLLATRYRDWGPTTEAARSTFIETYDHYAGEPLTATERRDLDRRVAALLSSTGWA